MELWCGLVNILNHVTLTDAVDRPRWKWTKNGQFSDKSLYIIYAEMVLTDP
jgi:hypothetical protein